MRKSRPREIKYMTCQSNVLRQRQDLNSSSHWATSIHLTKRKFFRHFFCFEFLFFPGLTAQLTRPLSSPTRNWTWALGSDWFAREYHPHHPKKQLLKDPNILTVTATFLGFTPNPWAEISKLRVNILETNLPSLPGRTTAHYHRSRKLRAACASPFRKGSLPGLPDSFLSRLNLWSWNSILQSRPARWQPRWGCVTTPYWSFWKDQESSSNKAYVKYSTFNLLYWAMLSRCHLICTNPGERPKTHAGTSHAM